MKEHWWRSWHGAPTDPKWLAIAKRANVAPGVVSAVAWALFDYASQNVTRGNAWKFDVEAYSAFSGFELLDVQKIINTMEDYGVIEDGRLTSWERRQPKREDDSTARVRAHRERNSHNAAERNVTQCNARGEERRGDKKERNIVRLEHPDFNAFYAAYPKKQSRKKAEKAYAAARREVSHEAIMAGLAKALQSDSRFRDIQFTPLPASWLNAGGYADETAPKAKTFREFGGV